MSPTSNRSPIGSKPQPVHPCTVALDSIPESRRGPRARDGAVAASPIGSKPQPVHPCTVALDSIPESRPLSALPGLRGIRASCTSARGAVGYCIPTRYARRRLDRGEGRRPRTACLRISSCHGMSTGCVFADRIEARGAVPGCTGCVFADRIEARGAVQGCTGCVFGRRAAVFRQPVDTLGRSPLN